MPLFNYRGIDRTGKKLKGTLTAESIAIAKQRVRNDGIMLTGIDEVKSKKKSSSGTSLGSGGRIKIEDVALVTRQLAILLKAKVQVVECFNALVEQTENRKLKVILDDIRRKVKEGSSLASALSDYPKVFNNIYINMVEAGEASGMLDVVLLRLADFTESQVQLNRKVQGAMIYPLIMIIAGSGMMAAIFIAVIPKITKIFISMKKTLPIPTQICIWISNALTDYWWLIIASLFFGWVTFKKWSASKEGEKKWHSILLKIPIVGKIITMVNVSRFCSTLATLLDSGVPILGSMDIVKNLVSNVHMQKAIGEARTAVKEGATMTGPLLRSELFPPMMTHMILLGEKSGELEPMLKIVAKNYEEQVESTLNNLTATLEPIMMVAMGGAVGFIVFSVVMPMMDLNSFAK